MVKFYLSPRPDKRGECPIRVSISIRGTRLISTAGYSIAPDKWKQPDKFSKELASVKRGHYNEDGIAYNIINARLKAIDSHFSNFEIGLDHKPTIEELAEHLASVKGTTSRKQSRASEETTALFYFDKFVAEESRANQWADGTIISWQVSRRHLRQFGENALLSDFNENGLAKYLGILRNRSGLSEVSAQKEMKHLKWFLRWCIRKGYSSEDAALRYKPKFHTMPKPVIFLTKDELLKLYRYRIPSAGTIVKLSDINGKEYEKTILHEEGMNRAKDLFCFCCFSGLRYSDAIALKKSDIANGCINVVTKKTSDALSIDLSNPAKEILDRYKDAPGEAALPSISIQKLGNYIKDLGEILGFNEPITRSIYVAGKRKDVSQPKWQLLSSHTGRKTFVCYALSVGISPQVVMKWTGHRDYKSMLPYIDIASDIKQRAMVNFNRGLEEGI